eukprot:g7993.t1
MTATNSQPTSTNARSIPDTSQPTLQNNKNDQNSVPTFKERGASTDSRPSRSSNSRHAFSKYYIDLYILLIFPHLPRVSMGPQ